MVSLSGSMCTRRLAGGHREMCTNCHALAGTTKDENHLHPSPVEGEEVREGPFSYKLRRGSSNSCTFKSISSIIGGWLCADQDIQTRDQPLHVRLQEQGARFPCG